MLIDVRRGMAMGVTDEPIVLVPTPEARPGTAFPARRLTLRGTPVFELALWCGTCPAVFQKLSEAEIADLGVANELLTGQVEVIDERIVEPYGKALPRSNYSALLLEVRPRLVLPGDSNDYFSREQVATWGVDPVLGGPEEPGTPYYRTFETSVGAGGRLYEFIVPMVPPSWNDPDTVDAYVGAAEAGAGDGGTAVAYSLLDIVQPATDRGEDYHEHWVLTHFLLDGHHKVEAAALATRPIRLLSFLDEQASLASADQVTRMLDVRSRALGSRG